MHAKLFYCLSSTCYRFDGFDFRPWMVASFSFTPPRIHEAVKNGCQRCPKGANWACKGTEAGVEERLVEACPFFKRVFFWHIDIYRSVYFTGFIRFTCFEENWRWPVKTRSFSGCRICLSYLAGSDATGSQGKSIENDTVVDSAQENMKICILYIYTCVYMQFQDVSSRSLENASTLSYQCATCRHKPQQCSGGQQ